MDILCLVKVGSINVPITLEYEARGVKVAELEGDQCGVGWNLSAGGKITRVLADLPDDKPNSGWLHTVKAGSIETFSISNDGNISTCTDETTDVNFIDANFPIGIDSEPDVFHVAAPGLNCKIVFDKNHLPKIILYKDYKVAYTKDVNGIATFTITKDDGTVYHFTSPALLSKWSTGNTLGNLLYLQRSYYQYKT